MKVVCCQNICCYLFPLGHIFEVAMSKFKASEISTATASLIASEKGVLLAARKSFVFANGTQQHEMDLSDVPKVLTLYKIECRPYLAFASSVVARKEIDSALKAFAFH